MEMTTMTMTPSEALRYMDGLDFIDDKAKARHNEAVEALEMPVQFTAHMHALFGPDITADELQRRLEALSMRQRGDVTLLEARATDEMRAHLFMFYLDQAKTIPIKSPEGADAGHANAARITVAMQFTEQALAVIGKRWGHGT
jgi:hypothetical protein